MFQKSCRVLWAKAHLKLTVSKWKSVLWSDKSKFDILVGNHGRHVREESKKEGDRLACHQCSVQKPTFLMEWGCICAYGMGSLHVLEGTMNAERFLKILEQHMLPSRRRLFQERPCVFRQDNAKPHAAAITTAWLRSRRVWVMNWPACSPDLSPIESIWCIIKLKYVKDDHKLFSSWKPISGKNGTKFQHQNSRNSMPRCLQTVLKEEEMLHHGKNAPVPTILRPVAGITFEIISFCAWN